MALDLADYETKARDAVMAFWGNREKARQKQVEAGFVDQGERARRLVMHHDRLSRVSEAWVWLAEARMLLRRLVT